MKKIAVVTGASSGIGFTIATLLHEQGYIVYGLSRNFPQQPYSFHYLLCDLANSKMIENTVLELEKTHPAVDILINNAGMGIGGAIELTNRKDVEKMFQVNVFGLFDITRAFLPLLRKSKQAKIVNIGSVAGDFIVPFQGFYSMTKASVSAFSEALRNELRPSHIDVTTILPGDTKTDFTKNREKINHEENPLYGDRISRSLARMERDETNGAEPMKVAKIIAKLIKKRSMPVRKVVDFKYSALLFISRFVPKRFVNWAVYQLYGK